MRLLLATCAMLLLCGCERAMHNMYDQPKYKPGAPSPLFADGRAGRGPPLGTVPATSGAQALTSSGQFVAQAQSVAADRLDQSHYAALLQRGRARYDIFCAPCHGLTGEGNGMVVARGFPAPPPFTRSDVMAATNAQLAQVIQRGEGVMYPFADRVDEHDRQAIVAYMRALQLSQHAPVNQLDAQDRSALQAAEQAR